VVAGYLLSDGLMRVLQLKVDLDGLNKPRECSHIDALALRCKLRERCLSNGQKVKSRLDMSSESKQVSKEAQGSAENTLLHDEHDLLVAILEGVEFSRLLLHEGLDVTVANESLQ